MKIEKTINLPPVNPQMEGKAGAAAKGSPNRPEVQPDGTSVSLGSTATQLRGMEEGMAASSPVNAAKVAEIKQAISEGRFKVNSEVVAERLIATVRDLIGDKA